MKFEVGQKVKIFDRKVTRAGLGYPAEVVEVSDLTVRAFRQSGNEAETFWILSRAAVDNGGGWIATLEEAANHYLRDILMTRIEGHGLDFQLPSSGRPFTTNQLERLAGLLTEFERERDE